MSKTFSCIPRDLIEKVAAYVFKNQKQSVHVNNTNSSFKNIISMVSKGSILVPILFNISKRPSPFHSHCVSPQFFKRQ